MPKQPFGTEPRHSRLIYCGVRVPRDDNGRGAINDEAAN